MRVLVCGSRDWEDRDAIYAALDGVFHQYECHNMDRPRPVLIEGGSSGADAAARWWYGCYPQGEGGWGPTHCGCSVRHESYPADWKQYGSAAGPRRNQQMLNEGKPDLVLAFKSKPRSSGTDDMIRRAKGAGVPVYVVTKA